jgi:hypothetical protein
LTNEERAAVRARLRRQFWAAPPDAEFDRPTVGALIDVGAKTMELRASRGDSPPYVIRGKRAWYKKSEVLKWLEKEGHSYTSTAEREQPQPQPPAPPAAERRDVEQKFSFALQCKSWTHAIEVLAQQHNAACRDHIAVGVRLSEISIKHGESGWFVIWDFDGRFDDTPIAKQRRKERK